MSITLCLDDRTFVCATANIGTVAELLQLKLCSAPEAASLVAGGRWFPGAAPLADVLAAAGDGPALVVVPATGQSELIYIDVPVERVVRQSANLQVGIPVVPDETRSETLARAAELVEGQLYGGEHGDVFWETESVDDVALDDIELD